MSLLLKYIECLADTSAGRRAQPRSRAIAPAPAGKRKVVLATSIAETSLTIQGVRVVIDSGQARVPRFDPASGLTRLAKRLKPQHCTESSLRVLALARQRRAVEALEPAVRAPRNAGRDGCDQGAIASALRRALEALEGGP